MKVMVEEKKGVTIKKSHSMSLEGRAKLRLTGVEDVDRFDDQTVAARTVMGELVIKGEGLHIGSLNVDTGELLLEGRVDALLYREAPVKGGLLAKLFR